LPKDIGSMIRNVAAIAESMNLLVPTLKEVAPHLPQATKKALEAIGEAVVVLKAMQRSFLLKGSVNDIRDEEIAKEKTKEKTREKNREKAKEANEQNRQPAGK
jgi:dihydroxyacid dehydratase/phosphogluconate dehydratase